MKPLTARQQQVLDAVCDSIAAKGYPPTFREISAALGGIGTNAVNDHLSALERKGAIRRDLAYARGIALTEAAEALHRARRAAGTFYELVPGPLGIRVADGGVRLNAEGRPFLEPDGATPPRGSSTARRAPRG
jgi:SOS-response transcriptional repressor LexA